MYSINKRKDWVDIVKAFAIIAVVLGHISYQYPQISLLPISTIIAWLWHVPVFFIIGGFFLKDERLVKPQSFIKGKIHSLYLPILYLYIPFVLLHNVLIYVGFYDTGIEYGGKYVNYWSAGQFVRSVAETVFLAGREPILGAMWFVYVLFIALCYLSIVSFLISSITPPIINRYEQIRCLVLLFGAVISSILTNVFDITIPRFNNVFTASWLIYVGMLVSQRYKVKFDSTAVFLMSVIVFYSFAVLRGDVHLNRNQYDDIVSLTVSSLSALYIVAFISKKCKGYIAKVLTIIGRDSFYIMGLHFFAFKLGTVALNNLIDTNFNPAELVAPAQSILFYVYYAFIGITLPLVMIGIWRMGTITVKNILSKCK